MKTCSVCKTPKALNRFNSNKSRIDGVSDRCKECYKIYQREWYQKNKDKRKTQLAGYDVKRVAKNKAYVLKYFQTHTCLDCSEIDPVVLQFDHRDPSTNVGCVADIVQSYGIDKIVEEINKCEVRCANCHIRRHHRERDGL